MSRILQEDGKVHVPSTLSFHWSSLSSAAFLTQTVCLDDTTVKFEIWDTAGQERYHSLAPMYYRGAQAAIVVYDITNTVGFTCRARREGGVLSDSSNMMNLDGLLRKTFCFCL